MKIEELNPKPAATQVSIVRADKPEVAEAHREAIAKQQPAADKVELSSYMPEAPKARHLEFRTEKVEELKSQIQAGTYAVSGRAVAEKMLSKIVMPNAA
ncbi:Negative regulator of flagellin synthesis FlgM [Citrifermentans bremense]|uniref:Negative regulator of flagellin synthesis n=2 Tax=Geobacteraceae TaxID=213422 RepID=A0ABQ0MKK3_9BACT|nr:MULTISPECIES: flagellar biosynthesis anti-sigma factor FlgM [Geobacteraceae]BCG46022.1 Negative regulator of flagellin synthesis FlgM [Citrifermentans bremense]GAW67528.1 flgM protein [Geoanaerobacter pelophilus]